MSQHREQCKEYVYHRDTYRRTGRGSSGFEMHYFREQCKRRAKVDGYCWQHAQVATRKAEHPITS